jgi:uncharacterized protein YecA (UPF0149 family)
VKYAGFPLLFRALRCSPAKDNVFHGSRGELNPVFIGIANFAEVKMDSNQAVHQTVAVLDTESLEPEKDIGKAGAVAPPRRTVDLKTVRDAIARVEAEQKALAALQEKVRVAATASVHTEARIKAEREQLSLLRLQEDAEHAERVASEQQCIATKRALDKATEQMEFMRQAAQAAVQRAREAVELARLQRQRAHDEQQALETMRQKVELEQKRVSAAQQLLKTAQERRTAEQHALAAIEERLAAEKAACAHAQARACIEAKRAALTCARETAERHAPAAAEAICSA